MTRRSVGVLVVLAAVALWTAQAQEPAKPKADTPKPAAENKEVPAGDPAVDQEKVARQYKEFEDALLRVAMRLEKRGNPEDRERAALIRKALDEASKMQLSDRLTRLAELLRSNAKTYTVLSEVVTKGEAAEQDLRKLLELLLQDISSTKDLQEKLKKLIAELEKAIRLQGLAHARTNSSSVPKEDAQEAQKKATEQVKRILEAMKPQDKKDTEKKDDPAQQGDPRGQGKGEGKGQGKGDGKGQGKGEGKGDGKGEGKGQQAKGEGKGQGQAGQGGGQGQGQAGGQGEGKGGGQQGQQGEQQAQSQLGRKQVEDAQNYQRRAMDKIDKNDRRAASDDQMKAKQELEKAKRMLEQLLAQLREEEIERLLADLQRRVEKMLQLQEIVYDGTKRVDKNIQTASQKPSREDELESRRLSEREDEIVQEADKAIALIQAEGSAVAFAEVFQQVRNDMAHVSKRLFKTDVGKETQLIEEDIIATLKEMIEALKKAQQDIQDRRAGRAPPLPPNMARPLLDIVAELKMIKAMQVRVYNRTVQWGKRYAPEEQANDPDIVRELKDLSQRQLKIHWITDNIAKGRNR